MKKKILLTLSTALISVLALTACVKKNNDGGDDGDDDEPTCLVKFYTSYNAYDEDQKLTPYHQVEVKRGKKITDVPADPVSEYPEFPVFKGWSEKEIIDNLDDLWDFDSDVVNTTKSTFNLFGIWVAEGEQDYFK